MQIKRLFRLQSPDDDTSGTGVGEVVADDQSEVEQEEQELAVAGDESEQQIEEQPKEESDELIVTLGDEQPEEEEKHAPNWVKDLRRKNREDQKRLRELEEENQRLKGVKPVEQETLGAEPKIDDPDIDFDADKYAQSLKNYLAKKASFEARQAEVRKQQEAAAQEWAKVQENYQKGKARFNAETVQEAESEVVSVLSAPRQAMLMDMADDSAALVVALGKNPKILRDLASVKSDARFIKELTKIEGKMQVQTKTKTPPPPERTITGSGKTPGASANKLEQLHAEAMKTGEYGAYLAEKRRQGK